MFIDEGIVIKRKKISEADLSVTVLFKTIGKVNFYIRNGNNPKNRLHSILEPFVYSKFHLNTIKSKVTIYSGDIIKSYYSIRERLENLYLGSYLLETVDKSLGENDSNKGIFDLLVNTLNNLENIESDYLKIKSIYDINLIKAVGYDINTNNCAFCSKDVETPKYINIREGGLVCEDCSHTHSALEIGSKIGRLLIYFKNQPIDVIMNTNINVLLIEKLDIIINKYLDFHLDLGLIKSRQFLKFK